MSISNDYLVQYAKKIHGKRFTGSQLSWSRLKLKKYDKET